MTMTMRKMIVMRRRDSKMLVPLLLMVVLTVCPNAWNLQCLADSSYFYDPFELSGGGDTTEYDAMVIDPLGAIYSHGAPYGGYGRASRAALARLPLILPEISSSSSSSSSSVSIEEEEEDAQQHHYFRVRDHGGQLFACRLYHEDALDRSSLHDSMFTPPVLQQQPRTTTAAAQRQTTTAAAADPVAKTTTTTAKNIAQPQQQTSTTATTPASSSSSVVRTVDQPPKTAKANSLPATTRVIRPSSSSSSSIGGSAGGSSSSPTAVTGSSPAAAPAPAVSTPATTSVASTTTTNSDGDNNDDSNIDPVDVELTLRESLHGVCGQVHKGYWSYEWCFEREVTQFHVEYDTTTNQVKVDQVTNLGMYAHREMHFLDRQNDEHTMVNEWAEDEPEVARIVDAHLDGTLCGGTDMTTPTPRRTYALLQCCSDKIVKRHKGMIHREGRPYQTDLIAVLDVVEDPDIQCLYNVTVCTPLLCGSSSTTAAATTADNTANAVALAAAQAAVAATRLLEDLNGINKINHEESIRQILDRTLNQLCLQSQSGGWWVYEICHRKSIRQYHETLGVRKNSAGAKVSAKVVESEHILGRYDITNESHVPDEEEWKLVVNATTTTSTAASLLWGEGNGAYYQVEYTGGDTCDTADVTDSAVVAGTKTAGGSSSNKAVFLLQRAASVRYHCGHTFDVQVSEDTTCHYIVDVKVPGLCRHPLFRAPIAKKQVMKCLPVPDDE
jgi:Glucosidase II beta subunit-like protein